jgi:hypothetical protein
MFHEMNLANFYFFIFLKIFVSFFTKKLGKLWIFFSHGVNPNNVFEKFGGKKYYITELGEKKSLLSNS